MKPWVEEYHPQKLKQIVGNSHIIKKLRHMVDNGLQNLIITGFSGCGKSSSIFAIINETKSEYIELNASDERNISTIRSTIKNFAMKKSFSSKIIVLEEIDNMPKGSQHGIASLMQESNAHFILTCNDYNKIIESLTGRCMILKFKTINEDDIVKRLGKICRDKKLYVEDNVLNVIAKRSEGDLRKAINMLQTLYFYDQEKLSMKNLIICSVEPSSEIIYSILTQNLEESFESLRKLINQGYDCTDIISFLFKECSYMDIPNKLQYLQIIGDTHVKILHGGSDIHLFSLLIELKNCHKSINL
jgi:replication factor C small subunit